MDNRVKMVLKWEMLQELIIDAEETEQAEAFKQMRKTQKKIEQSLCNLMGHNEKDAHSLLSSAAEAIEGNVGTHIQKFENWNGWPQEMIILFNSLSSYEQKRQFIKKCYNATYTEVRDYDFIIT